MSYLVDVNVWVALAHETHVHRTPALSWFESVDDNSAIFCRVTQAGLLRLLSNHHVMKGDVLSPDEAWKAYDSLVKDGRVAFAQEPRGFEQWWREATQRPDGNANFWTDAYLAAFAKRAGYSIVSFDRGFQRYEVPLRLLT